jgi:hypothetical protein
MYAFDALTSSVLLCHVTGNFIVAIMGVISWFSGDSNIRMRRFCGIPFAVTGAIQNVIPTGNTAGQQVGIGVSESFRVCDSCREEVR